MSLFGSSPPEPASHAPTNQKSSLFDDDPKPAAKGGSGLFDDGEGVNDDSPWDMPTPRKTAKGDVVKTLLPATQVPETYVDAFDILSNSEYRASGGQIGHRGVQKLLESTKIRASEQEKILKQVTGGKDTAPLGRNEFNVLLALIGLSLEGEEATLDSVDERRKSKSALMEVCTMVANIAATALPDPSLPFITQLKNAKVSENLQESSPPTSQEASHGTRTTPSTSPNKSRRLRKDSLENLDADPWASPAMPKGRTNDIQNEVTPANTVTAAKSIPNGFGEPHRTTSAFTTHSTDPAPSGTGTAPGAPASGDEGSGGWGSLGGGLSNSGGSGLGGEGFGSGGGDQGQQPGSTPSRALGGGRRTTGGVEETVTITLLPEKEGVFMFQHHNYEVKSVRRNSLVIRRYSDFVWLLNCLLKRYPFRQVPLLPPKTIGGKRYHPLVK